MHKKEIHLNLKNLDDLYRHYHDIFRYIIETHREKLSDNNSKVVLYDEQLEKGKKIKKVRKEFEELAAYNNWMDEHYPSN